MELFNEMFSVDCINPVDNATELDAKHFLRIGSLYLWVQRRSAPSTPHAHAYFRGMRRVKAGMTSPDERDRRLYEKYSLCDYELPFVCLVLSEQKKNSFTIVLHDHRGTLAREDPAERRVSAPVRVVAAAVAAADARRGGGGVGRFFKGFGRGRRAGGFS